MKENKAYLRLESVSQRKALFPAETRLSMADLSSRLDSRNAFAKALYGRMFGWIVSGINGLLQVVAEGGGERKQDLDVRTVTAGAVVLSVLV